jgi:hypothetical protein
LLVDFSFLGNSDPRLPLPLVPFSLDFWQAWGAYARHLPSLHSYSLKRQTYVWRDEGKSLLDEILFHLARPSHYKQLSRTELNYLKLKLALPLAWPQKGGL